jgi:hypothetical protein
LVYATNTTAIGAARDVVSDFDATTLGKQSMFKRYERWPGTD